MCSQNMVNVENIIQHTQRLNVANTYRRRIPRRRQKQHDEAVIEQPDDQGPHILHNPIPPSPRQSLGVHADITSSSGHQQEYYAHDDFRLLSPNRILTM